ncbi:hypothetical protein HYDPIDRAFT_45002, partial [Hydnomerulius pinastri MD-312]
GRNVGEWIKLTEYVAQNKPKLLAAYGQLTPTQRQAYNTEAQAAREVKVPPAHANTKGISNTVTAAYSKMDCEWPWFIFSCITLYVLFTNPCTDIPATSNCQRPLNKLISDCRTLIQEELDYILMEKKVRGNIKMNYSNYERAIVECYGVALRG